MDIDSIFICGWSLLCFQSFVSNKIKMEGAFYSPVKNIKATKAIDDCMQSRGHNPTFLTYYEAPLLNFDNQTIYVIFCVNKATHGRCNFAMDFINKVIRQAIESMDRRSETHMFAGDNNGGLLNSQKMINIVEKDYPNFASLVDAKVSRYIRSQRSVVEILFYKCSNGIRCRVDKALKHIKDMINVKYLECIIFTQIHFGMSIKCQDNSCYLIDLQRAKLAFANVQGVNYKPSFNFFDYGYIYGYPRARDDLGKIDYFQTYETVSHRITDKTFSTDFVAYVMTNGYTGEWNKYANLRRRAMRDVHQYEQYFKGMSSSTDIRIEVVETFANFSDIFGIKNSVFASSWSADRGVNNDNNGLTRTLQTFIRFLLKNKLIVMMSDWPDYLRSVIHKDIQLLKKMILEDDARCAPTKTLLNLVYAASQRIACFFQSDTRVYDHKYLKNFQIVEEKDSRRMLTRFVKLNVPLPDSHYTSDPWYTRSKYLGSNTPKIFKYLYDNCRDVQDSEENQIVRMPPFYDNTFSSAEHAPTLVRYFFQLLAGALEHLNKTDNNKTNNDGNGTCKRRRIDPNRYFRTSRTVRTDRILLSREDVILSVINPKATLSQFLHGHCFGDKLRGPRNNNVYVGALKKFIAENVEYYPLSLMNGTSGFDKWSLVVGKEKMRKIYIENPIGITGPSYRMMNLLPKAVKIDSTDTTNTAAADDDDNNNNNNNNIRCNNTKMNQETKLPAKTREMDKGDKILAELMKELKTMERENKNVIVRKKPINFATLKLRDNIYDRFSETDNFERPLKPAPKQQQVCLQRQEDDMMIDNNVNDCNDIVAVATAAVTTVETDNSNETRVLENNVARNRPYDRQEQITIVQRYIRAVCEGITAGNMINLWNDIYRSLRDMGYERTIPAIRKYCLRLHSNGADEIQYLSGNMSTSEIKEFMKRIKAIEERKDIQKS